MRLLIWNINGLRAISKKEVRPNVSFQRFIGTYDIVVLNETKVSEGILQQNPLLPAFPYMYHSHSSALKGYSGVSILSKIEPVEILEPSFDDPEGRLVILEFPTFILVGVYVPNAGQTDSGTRYPKRHHYRTKEWDIQFRGLCSSLERKKPVIVMGDLNVAHTEMDVHNPNKNTRHAGFTIEERENFDNLLNSTTLVDVWRLKHPAKVQYSYFDYRTKARMRNAGWRIDYALVSKRLLRRVGRCEIIVNATGSDHQPLVLELSQN